MYFEFNCEKCSKRLKVREASIGGKVRCPYCHHHQTIAANEVTEDSATAPGGFDFGALENAAAPTAPAPGATPARKRDAGESSRPAKRPESAAARTPRAPQPAASEEGESCTDVSLIKSGIIGVVAFFVIYAVLYPFRTTTIGALMWDRGWVQFAETVLATWALAILYLKWRKIASQKDAMLFDLLPGEISREITPSSVDRFVDHIRGLPVAPSESFLINRVLRGLEHFRVLKNSGEVSGRLSTQSDIDANAVDSSYSMVKVLVWAIPILGFIGTVIGIGAAVAAFSSTMANAGDMGALKESFNAVTGGLGTAFDTTLLALVLSIFIMFPMTSLQKSEQDLLNQVDEYVNENLLKRVKDEGAADTSPAASLGEPGALKAAIDAALVPHQAELRAWAKKLDALAENFAGQMQKHWQAADEQMLARHAQMAKQLTKVVEQVGESVERLKAMTDQQAGAWTKAMEQGASATAAAGEVVRSNAELAKRSQEQMATLAETIDSLNHVLGELDGRQVVVQTLSNHRGWSLFGRRN